MIEEAMVRNPSIASAEILLTKSIKASEWYD